jgi:hypothetical protein
MKLRAVVAAALVLWSTAVLSAQTDEPEATPFVLDVIRSVALDPTTYAPGVITYGAMRLDWNSSQVFFQNGYVEQNAGYTVSGTTNSASISRQAGNRRITARSLKVLQLSLAHNVSAHMVERGLARRYPSHRKLLRVAGHIERFVVASYLSYVMSAVHFRQWQKNQQLAREFGYR